MLASPCKYAYDAGFNDIVCTAKTVPHDSCVGALCSEYSPKRVEESESQPQYDIIGKPSHYTEGRKYEPKDVIRDWGLNFNLGNAVKYISRAGRKDDILQDLKKARQYLDFEIEAIEEERRG